MQNISLKKFCNNFFNVFTTNLFCNCRKICTSFSIESNLFPENPFNKNCNWSSNNNLLKSSLEFSEWYAIYFKRHISTNPYIIPGQSLWKDCWSILERTYKNTRQNVQQKLRRKKSGQSLQTFLDKWLDSFLEKALKNEEFQTNLLKRNLKEFQQENLLKFNLIKFALLQGLSLPQ